MANMRAIRTRIKSVKNTQQITKAMKMVAVSKLRKTQAGMQAMRPFAERSQDVLNTLLSGGASLENPFITPRKEVKKVCYVLFVGNRGLCGIYNNAILHFMRDIAGEETRDYCLVVCGRWGKDVIQKTGMPVHETFNELSDTPNSREALEISEYLKNMYLTGEVDEVHLVYQHYVSALKQEPVKYQLLPAKPTADEQKEGNQKDFIFAPDMDSVLESVMRLTINNKILSVMLEAKCGEHSSRMTAMTAAADNTKELIGKLDLSLNRARQAAITTEISEIVGGAAALKKKKK
ncbi:MAG: ATP synthase F1 subunit gamma [Bacillota bacterium]|nr:ATP synthase F1 subunit gamma [Bacillota bacterium]